MRNVPQILVAIIPAGLPKQRVVRDQLGRDLQDRIRSLNYEDTELKADKLTLTIDNDDLANFDEPIWSTGNKMIVSWGYPEAMAQERTTTIRSVTGSRTLTIVGLGGEMAFDTVTRNTHFTNAKRSDVARIIANGNGFMISSPESGAQNVWIEDTEQVYDVIVQTRQTDHQLLRHLAELEGFIWYVDWDGFHFHRRKFGPLANGDRTVKKLTYYSDKSTTEIIDFSLEMDLTRIPGSLTTGTWIPEERQGIKIDATNFTDKQKHVLGERVEAPGMGHWDIPGYNEFAHHAFLPTVENYPGAVKKYAEAQLRRAQQMAVKMTITTVGDPNFNAKQVIYIDGMGKRLSQMYYIHTVRHYISDGYHCELELISDGSGGHKINSMYALELKAIQLQPPVVGIHPPDPHLDYMRGTLPVGGIKLDPSITPEPAPVQPTVQSAPTGPDWLSADPSGVPPVPPVPPPPSSRLHGGSLAPAPAGNLPGPANPFDPLSARDNPYNAINPGNTTLTDQQSHVRSYTASDGFTYVIPAERSDGTPMTEAQSISAFQNSGENLGLFGSKGEADIASAKMESDQVNRTSVAEIKIHQPPNSGISGL